MRVRSICRLTHDGHHNMCTGARWFQGDLFVAYRQGDAHVCPSGRLIVRRSRDQGAGFDTVAVGRGAVDTRDAHLYTVGDRRLHLAGFESGDVRISGTMWTDNGSNWSPWVRCTGADGWWLWHPEYFRGRYYCAGYTWRDGDPNWGAIAWFESDDAINWRRINVLREGVDRPSECCLAFRADGTAILLVRRDHASWKPLMMTSAPPYRKWEATELDIPIVGLALWLVGDEIWFSGRWRLHADVMHMGVFRLAPNGPELRLVLPSGPHFDFSYMGVARHPVNSSRFTLSYYSNHQAPDDSRVDQWSHPAIYLVDAAFPVSFFDEWQVSDVIQPPGGLAGAACPEPESSGLRWVAMRACGAGGAGEEGFVDAHRLIDGRAGVLYLVADFDVPRAGAGALHLGYDGPVRVWLNGQEVFTGDGDNPASVDQTSIQAGFRLGRNRVAIALDTNGGKAWGVFGRHELAESV